MFSRHTPTHVGAAVPSTQRGRTLGKLLSIPSSGHSAGWLRGSRPHWGPCRPLCSGGCENAKDPARVQNSDQASSVTAYTEQVLKQNPGQNGVVTAAKLVVAIA